MNAVAIVNPRSGNGRAAHLWMAVRGHLSSAVETLETKAPSDAVELAREAIKQGARTVVAVGGDGTINEVVNGFFEGEQPLATDASLAVVPHGTGSDFARILNLPTDERNIAAVIDSARPRSVDLQKVRYTAMDGSGRVRYAINVTSFGLGGLVAAKVARSSKVLGGRLTFLTAMLETALRFPGNSARLKIDGGLPVEERITNVVVGNGQYHGAGMWVCPGASINDGILDVTIIRHLSLFDLVKGLPMLYNGRIHSHPMVIAHRAKTIEATSRELTLIEIDGEPLGRLPMEISILPGAIRVLMP